MPIYWYMHEISVEEFTGNKISTTSGEGPWTIGGLAREGGLFTVSSFHLLNFDHVDV